MTNKNIIKYKLTKEDLSIHNPFLTKVMEIVNNPGVDADIILSQKREDLISEFAFSIPTFNILKLISDYSPIIEMGAGNGYWAYCLQQLGADIIAFDKYPPEEPLPWPWGDLKDQNYWFNEEWITISQGDENIIQNFSDRTLFLCWPTFHDNMASNILSKYLESGGSRIIYIGDRKGSGDKLFFDRLNKLKCIHKEKLWTWSVTDEYIEIYENII